jgi:hypothetical protein
VSSNVVAAARSHQLQADFIFEYMRRRIDMN